MGYIRFGELQTRYIIFFLHVQKRKTIFVLIISITIIFNKLDGYEHSMVLVSLFWSHQNTKLKFILVLSKQIQC